MFPNRSYRLLGHLTSSLHGAQGKTLMAVTASLLYRGQMRSFAIAQQLADGCQIKLKSGLQRFYRFMRNRRFDDLAVWAKLAHHLLAAAVGVGRPAAPIYVQTFSKTDMLRNQI